MATTLSAISDMMHTLGIKHDVRNTGSSSCIVSAWTAEQYRDEEGQGTLLMVVALEENGEYLKCFFPKAFMVPSDHPHREAAFRAMLMYQWKTKLIQFEWDESDGEVRPIIEFPLEENTLKPKQLHRCIQGLISLTDRFSPILERALEEGVVDFEEMDMKHGPSGLLGQLLAHFSDDLLSQALRVADQIRRH
jgi:hypothetical protein